MLLQTNSYIVPKDKRAEHARLLRRFRQALARVGCDHFEVYEQVGANWSGDTTGRFVQIMRFRDRQHQLQVQAAERQDTGAQDLIKEFCELINFPYQQQQGLFALGFYNSALPSVSTRAGVAAAVTPVVAEALETPEVPEVAPESIAAEPESFAAEPDFESVLGGPDLEPAAAVSEEPAGAPPEVDGEIIAASTIDPSEESLSLEPELGEDELELPLDEEPLLSEVELSSGDPSDEESQGLDEAEALEMFLSENDAIAESEEITEAENEPGSGR